MHAIFIWLNMVDLNYEHMKLTPLCLHGIFDVNGDKTVWGFSLRGEAVLRFCFILLTVMVLWLASIFSGDDIWEELAFSLL